MKAAGEPAEKTQDSVQEVLCPKCAALPKEASPRKLYKLPLPSVSESKYEYTKAEVDSSLEATLLSNVEIGEAGRRSPEDLLRVQKVLIGRRDRQLWKAKKKTDKPSRKRLQEISFDLLYPPNWSTRVKPQNPKAREVATTMLKDMEEQLPL